MSLTPKDVAAMLDHSTLQPWLTEDDIRHGCEIALKYQTASVCARPCDVPILAEMLAGSPVKVCTVIGFPHGSNETAVKVAEAQVALAEGCEEQAGGDGARRRRHPEGDSGNLLSDAGGKDSGLPPGGEGRGGFRQDQHGIRLRRVHHRGSEADAGQCVGGRPN